MMQADLFTPPEPPICRTCVVWSGIAPAEGQCSIHGPRVADAPACDRWFSTEQLRAPLYGRRAA